MKQRKLNMLTDLYQMTMIQGYLKEGKQDDIAVYDMFFRKKAGESGYAIMAGLEQVIDYIKNLSFCEEDISYLRSLGIFGDDFLSYMQSFKFSGDISAIPEGTVVFPGEPLLRVTAPLPQAQLIETAVLNIINHQTLIATKASRVVYAAKGAGVMEFGLRRAQGPDAGVLGARAAVIGGCISTSNVLAGQTYNLAVAGTQAHSWVMSFESELEAFRAYARTFPQNCLLLVDTYDTLKSGIPNAITVFNELTAQGYKPRGIRLDSGDLAYISKMARRMLDKAGFKDTIIVASSDMDENVIRDLIAQGAKIDVYGVGTKLITSENCPSLGGVYKLSAIEMKGTLQPKMKISENAWKITNPGRKKVVRLYSPEGFALADLITLEDEVIDDTQPIEIFHPQDTWKRMTIEKFTAKELLIPVFKAGKQVYYSPSVSEISEYCKRDLATLWDEYKRPVIPHIYKVDLSQKLWTLRQDMINGIEKGN